MDVVSSPLDRLAQELPELLELRQHLHAHPELSGEAVSYTHLTLPTSIQV